MVGITSLMMGAVCELLKIRATGIQGRAVSHIEVRITGSFKRVGDHPEERDVCQMTEEDLHHKIKDRRRGYNVQ
jgi:hypothetical protein